MRVQLMASARHAIDSRDTSLQSHDLGAIESLLSMVPRRVAVLLVLLWAFLRLRRMHRALSLQGKKVLA